VCVYVGVCVYVLPYVSTYVYIHVCIYVIHTYVSTYVCAYVSFLHVHTYIFNLSVRTYVCMYPYIYIYMRVNIRKAGCVVFLFKCLFVMGSRSSECEYSSSKTWSFPSENNP
jgi:hypothetical protein